MLHRKPRQTASSDLDAYRGLAVAVLSQAGQDLMEPLFARSAGRFLRGLDERDLWTAWTGLSGRGLKPEVLAAIEKVLARKARIVPRKLLRQVPVLVEDPDDEHLEPLNTG